MKKEWTVVEALSYARHDWMNQLQLIKGFLSLGQIERAEQSIEEVVMQARQESHLAHMGWPAFAMLILTLNWEDYSFHFQYEIMNEKERKPEQDGLMTDWCAAFFQHLEDSVKPFAQNELYMLVEDTSEGVRFFFDFSGTLTETEPLRSFLEQSAAREPWKHVRLLTLTEEEVLVECISAL